MGQVYVYVRGISVMFIINMCDWSWNRNKGWLIKHVHNPATKVILLISSSSFPDGEEEKTVSVLLNGEESSMSFIDPDADTVSINIDSPEKNHQWSVNSCLFFFVLWFFTDHSYLTYDVIKVIFFGKVPVF